MKVYMVWNGYELKGVYSSRDRAKEEHRLRLKINGYGGELTEVEVDSGSAECVCEECMAVVEEAL